MLDPQKAGAIWQKHFDEVTPEEFVANMKRADPDFAREIWGDRSVPEICADRREPVSRRQGLFASLSRSILRFFS